MIILTGFPIIKGSVQFGKPLSLLTWITKSGAIGDFESNMSLNYALDCAFATSYTLIGGALPNGLTLNSDGTITGTPSTGQDGSFSIIVQAGNGTEYLSRSFAMNIYSGFPGGFTGQFNHAYFNSTVFSE